MRERLLKIILLGFAGGIFFHSFFDLGWALPALLLFLGVLFAVVSLRARGRASLFGAALCVFAALGMLRFDMADRALYTPALDSHLSARVALEGVIDDEPDVRDGRQLLRVRPDQINSDALVASTHVLIVTDEYPHFSYGDRIKLFGVLQAPKMLTDADGRVFDYPRYLAKDGIAYQMLRPKIEQVKSGEGNMVRRSLYTLKSSFINRVSQGVPEPESSLVAGMLLGGKQSLGTALTEMLRKAGVVHIVVLSGYNVTIVAESIMRAAAFLPRVFALSLGAGSIVLFALMTGAGATVVRAAIMALIVVIARATGRPYEMSRALFIAGAGMIAINPHILAFDMSFQLSFLATLGLIYLSPYFEKKFSFVTQSFGLRGIVAATIATQIFVFPLILFAMGRVSIVGFITNLFILPMVPATMFVGFLAGLFGFVHTFVAFPFAAVAYLFSGYIIRVSEWFGSLPFAEVQAQWFTLPFLVFAYVVLFAAVYFKSRTPSSSTSSSRSTSALLR